MAREDMFKDFLKEITSNDYLPKSEIKQWETNRLGLYILNKHNTADMKPIIEDTSHLYGHEKFTPAYMAIKSKLKPEEHTPIYFRHFDGAMSEIFTKIISNYLLGIYGTYSYGAIHEDMSNKIGVVTPDFNKLRNANTNEIIEAKRLDLLLHEMGVHHEINSYYEFQELIKSGKIFEYVTPRGVLELAMCKIFVPNPSGEVDPNSRNVIGHKNAHDKLIDHFIRVDGEANTYSNDMFNRRSGKRRVPVGIFGPNESMEDYLKIIQSKDSRIDWEMFHGFVLLAKQILTRTNIDRVITDAYNENAAKATVSEFLSPSPLAEMYGVRSFYDFAEAVIGRSKRSLDLVLEALGNTNAILPFAEKYSKIPYKLEETTIKKTKQRRYDIEGRELLD